MQDVTWTAQLLRFVQENETLIEVVLFSLAFCESIVLVSFFVPASVLFLGIAALQSASGGDIMPMIIAGTLGAFLGDYVSYYIGWKYRNDLPNKWPFSRNPDWLPRARAFFDRWGILGVVVAKFVGPMRPLVPTISGAVAMPGRAFASASAVSSLVWSVVFLAPTYYGIGWLMN